MIQPKVFCIIVTYNGMQWIEKCLSSVHESVIPIHIIVIDNKSSDGTVAFIQKNFPNIELIQSEKNLGFGKANNIGLKKALENQADYVVLLNQDAWIDKDCISVLIEHSQKYPEYGIISPYHFNYEGTDTEVFFKEWVINYYTKELKDDAEKGRVKDIYACDFVHAACWLMPIRTIKTVGGFDPLFFHYGEDNDYVQRLGSYNLKAGIVPAAKFYHKGAHALLSGSATNFYSLTIYNLLMLKNPAGSTRGLVVLFFKQLLNAIFRGNKMEFKARFKNLKQLRLILKSRAKQKLPLAYLSD